MLATSAKPHQYRCDYLYHPGAICFASTIVVLMKCSRIEVAINDIGIQSRVQYQRETVPSARVTRFSPSHRRVDEREGIERVHRH